MEMLIGGTWQPAVSGTPYGLGAGIFTSDVSGAVRAIREIDAGNVHINWTPLWRADADLPGAGVWWDVAPAEVSTMAVTDGLRAEYESDSKEQRWFG